MEKKDNSIDLEKDDFMILDRELFARRLTQVCYGQGCNGSKLSRATGITVSLISHYLNGTKMPNLNNAYKIASYLGISIDYLVGNDEIVINNLDKIRDLYVLERDDKARKTLDLIDEIMKYYKGAKY